MWFEDLTGFSEKSSQQVKQNIVVVGDVLTSTINGKSIICGNLETPNLAELRHRVLSTRFKNGKISLREIVANVQ